MHETPGGERPDEAMDRAARAAQTVGDEVARHAADLGRWLRDARIEERLAAEAERRPWTMLAIAVGLGVAFGAAERALRDDDDASDEESAARGEDYLVEYEGALLAGAPRWTDQGRLAAIRRGPNPLRERAAVIEEWRPRDAALAGTENPLNELGRDHPVREGAVEGHVTRDSWRTGMIE